MLVSLDRKHRAVVPANLKVPIIWSDLSGGRLPDAQHEKNAARGMLVVLMVNSDCYLYLTLAARRIG